MQSVDAQVLTVQEAAGILRINRNTLYQALKRGELPSVRIGRRLLIPREALDALLSNRGVGAQQVGRCCSYSEEQRA